MNDEQNNACQECGAVIPEGGPAGLCGPCLLKLGLERSDAPEETAGPAASEETRPEQPGLSARTKLAPPAPWRIAPAGADPAPAIEQPGDQIGRYKLLQKIGEGGCGVVYMAEQEEPVHRRVALKVIKLGMDTRQVVARFGAERQALALMDHPNIAKVLDAGATETGRPYFVMELVRGIRVTDYCDQNQVSTGERLKLFTQVCQAIQHAHQKGVIHRDIKPSNILVTLHDGVPVPKVIDFGIAKATQGRLTDQTLFTAFEQFIGTPAYMSPEQAEMSGLDIDTRSDIYSLGVLLYELLVGTTPFAAEELLAAGLDQMRRTIREQEPVRPSTRLATMVAGELTTTAKQRQTDAPKLIHLVRGDLDWIVMKCLEKDRTRRYETANGLARDIERHLSNEPVVARPPSSAYKFQKFVRRNKVMVSSAALIATVLVIGVLASTLQAIRARNAEQQQARLRIQADAARAEAERQRMVAQAQEHTARLWAYVSDMNAAGLSLAEGDSQRARELLERHKPKPGVKEELRGFEWRHLWGLSRPDELFVLTNSVTSARYSPDGRMLAIADDSTGEVKLYDVPSRQVIRSFKPYKWTCWSVVFSPNGKMLATCSRGEPDFKLWDVATGEQIGTLTNRSQENGSVAFSPDGKRVVTVATLGYQHVPAEIKIWDLASQEELMSLPGLTSWVTRADFSPDGETIAAGDGKGLLRLWNLASGTVRVLAGHTGMVFYVRFSPDGKLLATGDENGTIILWDWVAGTVVRILTGHQGPIYGLAVSRDGHWLASASRDHTARLWDMDTGEELARLLGHSGRLWSIDFSPDGQSVVTAADDKTIRVWKATPKGESEILSRTSGGYHIGYSPDGRSLFVNETLWDVATKTIGHKLAGRDLTYSPDGKILALIRETNVVIYETATMRLMGTIPGKAPLTGGTSISPDGKLLALRSGGRPVIMDLEKMHEIATFQTDSKGPDHPWKVTGRLIFTRDSKILITADSPDGSIQLWNVPTGRPAGSLRGHQGRVGALALSPDGLMLASASEMTIRLWNLATLTAAEDPVLNGNNGAIYALAFSPDGKTLAAGSFDGPIKLWSIPGRQEIGSLKGHLSNIEGLAFSPDGLTLASTSYDHTLRLWKAPSFAETDASRDGLQARESQR